MVHAQKQAAAVVKIQLHHQPEAASGPACPSPKQHQQASTNPKRTVQLVVVERQDLELAGGGSGLQGDVYMCMVRGVAARQLGGLLLPTSLPTSALWKLLPALGRGRMARMQVSVSRAPENQQKPVVWR